MANGFPTAAELAAARLFGRAVRSVGAFARSRVRTNHFIGFADAMNIFNENDEVYRAISNGKLHMLPCFHTRPINVVVFHGSQGTLVFRLVSRLDAFSGYPFRI